MLDDRASGGLREGAGAAGERAVADSVEPLPEPTRRLPPEARNYWRTRYAGMAVGGVLAGFVVRSMLGDAGVEGFWTWLPLIVAAIAGPVAVAVLPDLRWRRWRFEIRDDEIDLHHGGIVARRTLVPIRRVQHVDTEAGVLRNAFGLATVSFHTAAGTTAIPLLYKGTAEHIRVGVAELARTRDDT